MLSDPTFKVANLEFLDALNEYRRLEFGDCLTKCASAFESVLKTVCKKRKWRFEDKDRASKLVQTVSERMKLPGYIKQQMMFIAELRNDQSTSHGGGDVERAPSRPIAQYAVNSTASAILFIVQEADEMKK